MSTPPDGAPPNGTADIPWFAEEVRRYDSDRFVACMTAPQARREALFALHAINLELSRTRELVSSPLAGQIRLQWWRDTLEGVCRGDAAATRDHPALPVLAGASSRYGLGFGGWSRLLDARDQDLSEESPSDLDAMASYAEATTSPLIHYSIQCLEGLTPSAAVAAAHAGTAWGLVGLIRAVPFHARYCRIHLPTDLMAAHALSRDDLLDGTPSPQALAAVLATVGARARAHIATARSLIREIPRHAVPALVLVRLAERYLNRLESDGWTVFASDQARPLPWRLTSLLWSAWRGRY